MEFAVEITQAATAAICRGGVLPDFIGANDVTIDADNDTFGIFVDGVDLGVLSRRTYDTGDLLAARDSGADKQCGELAVLDPGDRDYSAATTA